MTRPVHYATKAQVRRAVEAARAAGLEIGGVEVASCGTIRVLAAQAAVPTDPFDAWKARRAPTASAQAPAHG